jgi:hypothetical protein
VDEGAGGACDQARQLRAARSDAWFRLIDACVLVQSWTWIDRRQQTAFVNEKKGITCDVA